MNKIFLFLLFFFFYSCSSDKKKTSGKSSKKLSIEEVDIVQSFSDVDSLLRIDNGEFWGKNLYGPIIFIESETRVFYSNENNERNSFERIGSIFKDSLPSDINIANTAIDWNNKRWSMVMLPLPTNKESINTLIIHELFHRIQPEIGFENLQELDNGHLDSYNGRLLLRLELEALAEALKTNKTTLRLDHIRNALTFRLKRHKTTEIKNAENSLELNEGLAEYTAVMLSGRSKKKLQKHFIKSKNSFYSNPTFVRSFAYQTIPVYGFLLYSIKPDWHNEIDRNTNLTNYFIEAFKIDLNDKKSVEEIAEQNNYQYEQIIYEEEEREQIRIEKIATLKIKFIRNPTLELPFQNMNISFDPRNIIHLENFGSVYPNLRVTDNWGILTVENGALLAANWSKVTVSKPTEITSELVKGNGWKLVLNPEWKVEKIENEFKLLKK